MENSFKITRKELSKVAGYTAKQFPKYSASIINLLNRWAHGTDAKIVGQMSDVIHECPHKEYADWKTWYLKKTSRSTKERNKIDFIETR